MLPIDYYTGKTGSIRLYPQVASHLIQYSIRASVFAVRRHRAERKFPPDAKTAS